MPETQTAIHFGRPVACASRRVCGRGRPRSQVWFGRALPAPCGVPAGRDARAFPGVVCGRGRPRSQVWSAGGDARAPRCGLSRIASASWRVCVSG